jgi:hypothetical protein
MGENDPLAQVDAAALGPRERDEVRGGTALRLLGE